MASQLIKLRDSIFLVFIWIHNLHGIHTLKKFPKKYFRVTGLIYKVQNILHPKICLSLYNTLILPHINYCILSWGKENDAILLLQKRAVRAIASVGYRSHSEHLFKFYNLLKVNDIYKQRLLVFYYNIINKVISSNFNNFIPAFSEASSVYPITYLSISGRNFGERNYLEYRQIL